MHALVVTVPSEDVELASDLLWTLGVVAVEERPGNDATTAELWTSLGEDLSAVRAQAAELFGRWPCRFVEVDETVSETWRDFAEASWIDADFVVVPAWRAVELPEGVTVVTIEPGSTFGSGDHPTTRASLQAIRRVLQAGDAVLDVGCGSGVLAIAACVLGAGSAVGVDISLAAPDVTHANALANGVGGQVTASTDDLTTIDGPFDVVVANILAPALITLADELVRLVGEGTLVISGLLSDRYEHVVTALDPLVVVDRIELDGWVALTLRQRRLVG